MTKRIARGAFVGALIGVPLGIVLLLYIFFFR